MKPHAKSIWALIPVKDFGQAKQRLADVLTAGERAALARAMLCDVLRTLASVPDLSGLAVVTNDKSAAALASAFGARVLGDPRSSGTNAAVSHGSRQLRADGAGAILTVPADIPLINGEDIRAVLRASERVPLVLAPATRDQGTNMLFQAADVAFQPRFGPDSFRRHLAMARAAGIAHEIVRRERIGLDIDEPRDLALLLAQERDCEARTLLDGFEDWRLDLHEAAVPQPDCIPDNDARRVR